MSLTLRPRLRNTRGQSEISERMCSRRRPYSSKTVYQSKERKAFKPLAGRLLHSASRVPSDLPMIVGGSSYAFRQLVGYSYFNLTSTGASEEANIDTPIYNALQTSLARRFSHGLTANFDHTWSRMADNVHGNRNCALSIFVSRILLVRRGKRRGSRDTEGKPRPSSERNLQVPPTVRARQHFGRVISSGRGYGHS